MTSPIRKEVVIEQWPERTTEKRLRGDERYRDVTADQANTCGRAGEHLVCADILARGYECFIAEGRLPYDVVADIDGRMVRIQVKTTSGVKACPQRTNHTPVYMWNARKFGKGQRHSYAPKDTDLVAYVALDRGVIAYKTSERIAQSTVLRLREYEDQYYTKTGSFVDEFPLEKALLEIER